MKNKYYENDIELRLYDENTGNWVTMNFEKLFIFDMHTIKTKAYGYCIKINDRYLLKVLYPETTTDEDLKDIAEKEMVALGEKYNKFCKEFGRLF